jgi:uncharacterized protein YpiB (UPF0302 family)
VIYASIQLSNRQTSENTLNVSMKNSNSTNVAFVTRALATKEILKVMSNLCMNTSNLSNVIFVIIRLSNMQVLEDILNASIKNTKHNSTNVMFVKRVLV